MTPPAGVRKAPSRLPDLPTRRLEADWSRRHGGCLVAGIDEAGRGPLAGPVVAAAVVFDPRRRRPPGLQDSKLLTAEDRNRLAFEIMASARAWGVGIATNLEIDALNILGATRLAARRALEALGCEAGALITDALTFPGDPRPCLALVKGDRLSASVAAASILAKTHRDRMMDAYHAEFPEFRWAENRGYPTPPHLRALIEHGHTTLHRLTFNRVVVDKRLEPRRSPSYHRLLARLTAGEDRSAILREAESLPSLPPADLNALLHL